MAPSLRKHSRTERTTSYSDTALPRAKRRSIRPLSSGSASGELLTVYDLIRARADGSEAEGQPILFYPSQGTNYVAYTSSSIYQLSSKAAIHYNTIVPRRTSSDEAPQVVALLGPSDIDYLLSLLALSKLGHTVLLLSTRLSEEAHVSLLKTTNAVHLFVHDSLQDTGDKVRKRFQSLGISPIACREDFADCAELDSHDELDPTRETKNIAWIIHSSGSTSLPKPNYQTHAAALGNFKSPFNLTGFVTLPLYHMQGLGCVFRSIMNRKPIYMYNASLPLTSQYLTDTLQSHPDIEILYAVPYVCKLLADTLKGVELCRKLEVLFCGGAACPKPIGDKLTKAGVNLVCHLGSSETGQLMNSFRPRSEIEEWDWLRPSKAVQPYLRWEPYDSAKSIFELVVLDGWPSKSTSNRDDGSYATKDLWERHPDFPKKNAWRYYARKDDTIVLTSGEKANPTHFEDAAKESSMVDDAVVFGSERPHLGMFLVATDPFAVEEEVVDRIWPAIQKCNTIAPGHAQLSKDMIKLLSEQDAARIRKTDKGTIIRPGMYKDFGSLIDAAYADSAKPRSTLSLDVGGLRTFLKQELKVIVPKERTQIIEDHIDLFSMGIDSLQASRLRSAILRKINLGQNKIGENFVFDYPSITAMADRLYRIRTEGLVIGPEPAVEERMQALIEQYGSSFSSPKNTDDTNSGDAILVTGATGSLGSHLVSQLSARADVSVVYCLVRDRTDDHAMERLQESFKRRGVEVDMSKVRALAVRLDHCNFGLAGEVYEDLLRRLRCVVHCAWNVNFNLSLDSFERDIKGTKHLIDLCLKTRADFVFCSSVSTSVNSSLSEVPEELPASLTAAQAMGYAQSKLVAEHICIRAARATSIRVKVARIGQIVGDTKYGIWNAQEVIPMILRSTKTLGVLPKLDEWHRWLPVDTAAAALLELSLEHNRDGIFNVVHPRKFHWTCDLLLMLKTSGLRFDAIDRRHWLETVRTNPDPLHNPLIRVMGFLEAKYGGSGSGPFTTFDTSKARAACPSLADAPFLAPAFIRKLVQATIVSTATGF